MFICCDRSLIYSMHLLSNHSKLYYWSWCIANKEWTIVLYASIHVWHRFWWTACLFMLPNHHQLCLQFSFLAAVVQICVNKPFDTTPKVSCADTDTWTIALEAWYQPRSTDWRVKYTHKRYDRSYTYRVRLADMLHEPTHNRSPPCGRCLDFSSTQSC